MLDPENPDTIILHWIVRNSTHLSIHISDIICAGMNEHP
jgi:hypothetical protein